MKPENIRCPDCGGPMVSRATKRNVHDMAPPRRFWGCQDYPRCTGTRDTDGMSKAERDQERPRKDTRWS